MKLRNKKTGEIADFKIHKYYELSDDGNPIYSVFDDNIEDWEAYEEPREYFYIYADGDIYKDIQDDVRKDNGCKEIGNHFETKEEAEKAVEKLKAWKRLKDKGFEIEGWDNTIGDDYYKTGQIVLRLNNVKNREWDEYDQITEIKEELDTLFGDEE